MKVYAIARVCQVTPGSAYRCALACTGFYDASRITPLFKNRTKAERWLKYNEAALHIVKPFYRGQRWEVRELEVQP